MGSANPCNIKSAGDLGFIGSILYFIPFVNIVGYVLVLISLRNLSKEYGDESIWRNTIYGIITSIVSMGIVYGVIAYAEYVYYEMQMYFYSPSMTDALILIIGVVASYALAIVSVYFMRNAYYALADRSGIDDFRAAGKRYWLGALLAIVFVGVILMLIGLVHQIRGFNKLRKYETGPTPLITTPKSQSQIKVSKGTGVYAQETEVSGIGERLNISQPTPQPLQVESTKKPEKRKTTVEEQPNQAAQLKETRIGGVVEEQRAKTESTAISTESYPEEKSINVMPSAPPPPPPQPINQYSSIEEQRVSPIREAPQPQPSVAFLVLPSGWAFRVSLGHVFGRNDFANLFPGEITQHISARHFRVYYENGQWYIEDLGSTNGTLVNGRDIRGMRPVPLEDNDVISLAGVITLIFKTSIDEERYS